MASKAVERPKVFGIGIAKSGTKTLGSCFRELGYRNCSIRDDLVPAAVGDPAAVIAATSEFDSFEDFPWFWFYERLANRYPDARFILTRRRDDETWRRSFHNHMRTIPPERIELGRQLAERFLPGVAIDDLHRVHNERVRAFFADKPGRLLELCWEESPSWEALCAFLDCPRPAVPFPHENRGDYRGEARGPRSVRPPEGPPATSPTTLSPPVVVGIESAEYARRFDAHWRPVQAAETIEALPPKTLPGGPGTPPEIVFPGQARIRVPELGVLELEGARLIAPAGWILGAEGLLLANHTWQACQLDRDLRNAGRFAASLAAAIDKSTRTPLPGTTVSLLTDFGSHNYHHFLLDAIGRLALVEAAGIDLTTVDRILVPKPSSENARRILAAMSLPADKLVMVGAESPIEYLPERLLAPTLPGLPRSPDPSVVRFLRRRLLRQPSPLDPALRIYVDRGRVDGGGTGRVMENRTEVLDVMEDHGFSIYDPSDHHDQPTDFASAGFIVGAHGAGLTNIAFAPAGARVLELIPTDQIQPYYMALARATGLDHAFLPCRSLGERPADAFGPSPFPFHVDIAALREALTAIGCDRRPRRSASARSWEADPLDTPIERSILVIALGERPSIERALSVAERAANTDGGEIVVAGITDSDLIETIRDRLPAATLIIPAHPLSPAEARVCGAAAARGRRLFLVDGDSVVPARWIEEPVDRAAGSRAGSPHVEAARASLARGDKDGAILHYRQAIADSPQPPWVAAALAQILLEQDRLDEADRIFQSLVRRHPDDPVGYVGRARVWQAREAWQEALEAWKDVAARLPDAPTGLFGVGWALVELGRFEEGEALLEEAARKWPDAESPPIGLARAAAASGRHRDAHERWTNLVARFPKSHAVQINLARSMANLGDWQGAIQAYEAFVEGSRTPSTVCTRAEFHAAGYDWPAVVELIGETDGTSADDVAVHLRRIDLLNRLAFYTCDPAHLDRAVALAERLVGRCPHSVRARQALAEAYVTAGRDDDAARLIERLPRDPIPSHSFGRLEAWRLSHLGDVEGAKRIWQSLESNRHATKVHGPPGDLRQLDGRPVAPAPGEVLLFTVIRNEARRLPWFLSNYRRLGVDRFIVVDNDSGDGGTDMLLAEPDVHLFHTTGSYARAWSGMRWINGLMDLHGAGHWCLYVDPDELLVFPGVEESGLARLLDYMESRGHEAFRAFMLDMHGPTSGYRPDFPPGTDPLPLFPFFDTVHRRFGAVRCPYWQVTGGVRRRDGNVHNLTKTPIVRGGRGIRFLSSSHQTTPAAVSDVTGVLLHFKLAGAPAEWTDMALGDRSPGCIRRHRRDSFGDPSGDRDVPLIGATTVRYESSRQLMALGLIDCPVDYPVDGPPPGARHGD